MENIFLLVRVKVSELYPSVVTPIAVSEDIGNLHAYNPSWKWQLNCADIWVTNSIGNTFYRIDTVVNIKEAL